MEDGTVSIFGLVFGVAAAVSMMAGTYLDVESTNDQAAARLTEERARYDADPDKWDRATRDRLVSAGFSSSEAQTAIGILRSHPGAGLTMAAAVDPSAGGAARQNPFVQSAWMFLTDLFAAAVPVIPFAFLTLATAASCPRSSRRSRSRPWPRPRASRSASSSPEPAKRGTPVTRVLRVRLGADGLLACRPRGRICPLPGLRGVVHGRFGGTDRVRVQAGR